MTKNADPDKYSYSGCGIGLNAYGSFVSSDGSGFGKNVMIFGADISSSVHNDKKKGILILGEGPANGLDDTALTAEKIYSVNCTEQQKKFYLSLDYNGVNSFVSIHDVEICNSKEKDSEINPAPYI